MFIKMGKKFIGIAVIGLMLSVSHIVFANNVILTVHTSNQFMSWQDSSLYMLENDEVYIPMESIARLLTLSYSGKDGDYEVTNGNKKANLSTVGTSTISTPTKKATFGYIVPLKALCKFYDVDYQFDKTKNIVTLYGGKPANLSQHHVQSDHNVTTNNKQSRNIQLIKNNLYYYDYEKHMLTDLATGEGIANILISHYDEKTNTYLWTEKTTSRSKATVWKYDKDFNKIKVCDGDLDLLEDGYAYVMDHVNYPPGNTNITTLVKVDLTGKTENKVYKIKGRSTGDIIQYKGNIYFGSHPNDPNKPNVSMSSGTDKVYVTSGTPIFKSGSILYFQRYRKVGGIYKIDTYAYNLDTKKESKIITGADSGAELQKNGDLCYVKDGKLYKYSKGVNKFITNLPRMESIQYFVEDENYYYFSCFLRADWKCYIMRVNKKDNTITKLYTSSAASRAIGPARDLIRNVIITADKIFFERDGVVYELDKKTGKNLKEYPRAVNLFMNAQ